MSSQVIAAIVAASATLLALIGAVVAQVLLRRAAIANEAKARQRVRIAEDSLADLLRSAEKISVKTSFVPASDNDYDELIEASDDVVVVDTTPTTTARVLEQLAIESRDDRLTLVALWEVTHGRLDLYHQIVTNQARRSFGAAQVAIIIGFALLIAFALLAAQAKTTASAISVGSLGAVGAAFAAYIGRTFIRSQESAASHLRAYFDQPLELSRYLAAERLLADATDLAAEQRAAILSTLVQAIATAGRNDNKPKERSRKGKRVGA